ncbi:Hypothetical predicted protein, partial [Lynx pardinus]
MRGPGSRAQASLCVGLEPRGRQDVSAGWASPRLRSPLCPAGWKLVAFRKDRAGTGRQQAGTEATSTVECAENARVDFHQRGALRTFRNGPSFLKPVGPQDTVDKNQPLEGPLGNFPLCVLRLGAQWWGLCGKGTEGCHPGEAPPETPLCRPSRTGLAASQGENRACLAAARARHSDQRTRFGREGETPAPSQAGEPRTGPKGRRGPSASLRVSARNEAEERKADETLFEAIIQIQGSRGCFY